MSQEEKFKADYEAYLRRQEIVWQSQHAERMLSDRAAVDLGIAALKLVSWANAGALVTLLAFSAQIWEHDKEIIKQIFDSAESFVEGLIAAGIAFLVAYLYQSAVTATYNPALSDIPVSNEQPSKKIENFRIVTMLVMLVAAVASLALFAGGSLEVFEILSKVKAA